MEAKNPGKIPLYSFVFLLLATLILGCSRDSPHTVQDQTKGKSKVQIEFAGYFESEGESWTYFSTRDPIDYPPPTRWYDYYTYVSDTFLAWRGVMQEFSIVEVERENDDHTDEYFIAYFIESNDTLFRGEMNDQGELLVSKVLTRYELESKSERIDTLDYFGKNYLCYESYWFRYVWGMSLQHNMLGFKNPNHALTRSGKHKYRNVETGVLWVWDVE